METKPAAEYSVMWRKYPSVVSKLAFSGTKDQCIEYVESEYSNLTRHYYFDDMNFYKGNGAYYTNTKIGLEIAVGPAV